jgi:hypothetical protein
MKTDQPHYGNEFLWEKLNEDARRIRELVKMDPETVVDDPGFLCRARWMIARLLRRRQHIRQVLQSRAINN